MWVPCQPLPASFLLAHSRALLPRFTLVPHSAPLHSTPLHATPGGARAGPGGRAGGRRRCWPTEPFTPPVTTRFTRPVFICARLCGGKAITGRVGWAKAGARRGLAPTRPQQSPLLHAPSRPSFPNRLPQPQSQPQSQHRTAPPSFPEGNGSSCRASQQRPPRPGAQGRGPRPLPLHPLRPRPALHHHRHPPPSILSCSLLASPGKASDRGLDLSRASARVAAEPTARASG